jgi:hypothetical protein
MHDPNEDGFYMKEVEIPTCPNCERELQHTNTTTHSMLFSCVNINCTNYHYYLLNGERAYPDRNG